MMSARKKEKDEESIENELFLRSEIKRSFIYFQFKRGPSRRGFYDGNGKLKNFFKRISKIYSSL